MNRQVLKAYRALYKTDKTAMINRIDLKDCDFETLNKKRYIVYELDNKTTIRIRYQHLCKRCPKLYGNCNYVLFIIFDEVYMMTVSQLFTLIDNGDGVRRRNTIFSKFIDINAATIISAPNVKLLN